MSEKLEVGPTLTTDLIPVSQCPLTLRILRNKNKDGACKPDVCISHPVIRDTHL
jgi:hypothetical protein